ncbi:unnamed protein product [Peniophora sp. CBMAI 1063]|nr:unnamed protein product [Peniophora sp. CBMAI 1063]
MVSTTTLGGPAKDVLVAKVGTGLMLLTWTRTPLPDEELFEVLKTAIDAVPAGSKMLFNSAQFYALDLGTGNLELLARFFERYPLYADRVFLTVNGGMKNKMEPDPSPEGLRASIEKCAKALRGTKKVDLFQNARVSRLTPISEQMKVLKGFVDEGLIGNIGLSECSAATIREAVQYAPITAVEIEISPWAYEAETRNVIATCAELGIAIFAYSPLGVGFLTGELQFPLKDWRNLVIRYRDEHRDKNLKLVEALKVVAQKKGITAAQLCLAWTQALGERIIPIPCSTQTSHVLENLQSSDVKLSSDELVEIDRILAKYPVSGERFWEEHNNSLQLWG